MSKIVFFREKDGKVSAKKRKRMSGTVAKRKPEIKQCNTILGHGADYTAYDISPMFNGVEVNDASQDMFSWRLHSLAYPGVGANADDRIGNSIFLKSFRLKGYLSVSTRVFRPIHWRLLLYRFSGLVIGTPHGALVTAQQQVDPYLHVLYKNTETMEDDHAANELRVHSRHNYFKAVRKMPKDMDYSCKVIASGVVPVTNSIIEEGQKQFGTYAASGVNATVVKANEDKLCEPIDVVVKLNDRVTWLPTDNSTNTFHADVSYFLTLETDFVVGYAVSYPTVPNAQNQGGIFSANYTLDKTLANRPFIISAHGRFYYTDS